MAKATKCPGCALYFDRDKIEFVHLKNRYWHKTCSDAAHSKLDQDVKDLKILEDYIMKLFKAEYIDARIRKQLKDMLANYGFHL